MFVKYFNIKLPVTYSFVIILKIFSFDNNYKKMYIIYNIYFFIHLDLNIYVTHQSRHLNENY